VIFVNDRDGNFLPVISINLSPFQILSVWNEELSFVQAAFKVSLNFFNVNIGRWEPFVEPFSFELVSNQAKQEQAIQADFSSVINANFTEKLIENLSLSLKSWQICLEDYKKFETDTD
jgi:hypothetical protein